MTYREEFQDLVKLSYRKLDEPVKLKSGKMSYEYVNLREALARPRILTYVVGYMREQYESLFPYNSPLNKTLILGGKAIGALPLLIAMSQKISRPYFYVRDKKKEHGLKLDRDGFDLTEDGSINDITIMEDVITTGSSVMDVIHNLEGIVNYPVNICCVVLRDDQFLCEEMKKAIRQDEVNLVYMWTLTEFRNVCQFLRYEESLKGLNT